MTSRRSLLLRINYIFLRQSLACPSKRTMNWSSVGKCLHSSCGILQFSRTPVRLWLVPEISISGKGESRQRGQTCHPSEMQMKAQQEDTDPGFGPKDCLFIPTSIRSQVVQWGHSSKLICHPGVNQILAFLSDGSGGLECSTM